MHRAALFTEIATAWNERQVLYAVSHGLEGYPNDLGRDVDVLVAAEQVEDAIATATTVLEAHGLTVVEPHPMWGRRVVAVDRSTNAMLEVHLSTEVTWRGAALVRRPDPTQRVGVVAIDPGLAVAKRVLAPLLAGNEAKFVRAPDEFALRDGEAAAASALFPTLLPAPLAEALLQALRAGDLDAATALVPALRRGVLTGAARREPHVFVMRVARGLTRKVRQPFSPCAPVIAFVGPDGAGKSTVIRAILEGDRGVFTQVLLRHWRPFFLPRLGALAGRPAPTPGSDGLLPPRRRAGRFSRLRLAYFYLDYLLGGWFRDRVATSRQQLVLYDRCALDMEVDPARYGLRSGALRGWARWPLPWPDRIVLLTCDAATIHARKPELPVEELEQHLAAWQRLVDRGDVDAVLRTDAPPAEVVRQARALITDAFVEVNRRRVDQRGPAALRSAQ